MNFLNQLGQRPTQQPCQQVNPTQMMQQLRADPAGFMRKAGLDIPAGMTDPQQMVEHLRRSKPQLYQQAVQMMRGRK